MVLTNQKIDALYRQLGPLIYARCCRMLKDPAAAEDATQDIFLKLMRLAEVTPGREYPLAWVHRVTINHCLNVIRDGARVATSARPETLAEARSAGVNPEQAVVNRDFTQRLLASQPEELRAPALMFHVKGMDQSGIAKWLGVSRRTVLYRLAEFSERAAAFRTCAEMV